MIKLLFLFALAYFIYRTIRNLVDASLGARRDHRRFDRRYDGQDQADDRIGSDRAPKPHAPKSDLRDIDDARWTDL